MRQTVGGLNEINTSQKAKIRSMPKSPGRDYLDLYLMTLEKDRLEQEKIQTEKRKSRVDTDLERISHKMGELKKAIPKEDRVSSKEMSEKRVSAEPFKIMSLDY